MFVIFCISINWGLRYDLMTLDLLSASAFCHARTASLHSEVVIRSTAIVRTSFPRFFVIWWDSRRKDSRSPSGISNNSSAFVMVKFDTDVEFA